MSRVTLLAGVAIGLVAAVVLGKDKLTEIRGKAMDVWESPKVKDAVSKADRYVAEKAPTLHGMGEAVADSMPRRGAAGAPTPSTSTAGTL